MRQKNFRSAAPVWAALLPLVLWLATIAACVYEDGMNLFNGWGVSAERWNTLFP